MYRLIWAILLFPLCAFAKPVIILDPGHGGKDQGARVRTLEEKKLTLRTALMAKKHLEERGYQVVLTRGKDIFLPLGTRVNLANRRSSSLFVSIHYNSASSPAANGIEVYYYGMGSQQRKEKSRSLAFSVIQQMVGQTKARSRGVKQGNYQVIRQTAMPAVLIEAGFLTNGEERNLLGTQEYLDSLAKGIALGIDRYVKQAKGDST